MEQQVLPGTAGRCLVHGLPAASDDAGLHCPADWQLVPSPLKHALVTDECLGHCIVLGSLWGPWNVAPPERLAARVNFAGGRSLGAHNKGTAAKKLCAKMQKGACILWGWQ